MVNASLAMCQQGLRLGGGGFDVRCELVGKSDCRVAVVIDGCYKVSEGSSQQGIVQHAIIWHDVVRSYGTGALKSQGAAADGGAGGRTDTELEVVWRSSETA